MRLSLKRTSFAVVLLLLLTFSLVAQAQDDQKQPAAGTAPPEILDEPQTVDPATLVPKQLATAVTIDFADSTLKDVARWIQEEQKLAVLFDNSALSEKGILLGEPVSDRLNGDPIYLLLNRLSSLGLASYVEDDILHITTIDAAESRMLTNSYNVNDLFDKGYKPDDLISTLYAATDGKWADQDGTGGSMEWLGDVLFVRQTDGVHRQVAGLIAALRKHGRQTFTLDPPQHLKIRQTLNDNVSVKYQNTPLFQAIQELAEQTKIDMRLDAAALRANGVRDREPVSLTLSDRKLSTVLHVLLTDLKLTWILRDGVLWITAVDRASACRKTAVYDVRDLCRNYAESGELTAAIEAQTNGPWEDIDGDGGRIEFPQAGTLVIHQTESVLGEVRDLLAAYRKALLTSKPRNRDANRAKEVITRYYRIHENTAADLVTLLPQLVQADTWKTDQKPEAVGTILRLASAPELIDSQGRIVHASTTGVVTSRTDALIATRAVLIIRQTRAAHQEIVEVIRRVEHGDPVEFELETGHGGAIGGGGFGGGYFSIR